MKNFLIPILAASVVAGISARADDSSREEFDPQKPAASQSGWIADFKINAYADALVRKGRQIFRYDTFGDEAFWGGALKLNQAIAGESFGGVGPGVFGAA